MFKFLARRQPPPAYTVPDGVRVYAIGDVHGRYDLLRAMLDLIDADDAARPPAEVHLILLGDLIDRGPQSAETVEFARRLATQTSNVQLLTGNHEEVFIAAAEGDRGNARALLSMGGAPTLLSYGFSREEIESGSYQDLADLMVERIPRDHLDFLRAGRRYIQFGDYLFAHAGIRPGIDLEDQSDGDLRWIRRPFLDTPRGDGLLVIHGHTPARAIDIDLKNERIGIDTLAYESGILTAIGIEGDSRWFIQTGEAPGAG